mmetsp:Transcript_67632/g.207164  ORF Transcript_67632/g.207164 Transcript_67632/m.207164 type:complete len:329 (-) Transcript_67632:323-1309(-)
MGGLVDAGLALAFSSLNSSSELEAKLGLSESRRFAGMDVDALEEHFTVAKPAAVGTTEFGGPSCSRSPPTLDVKLEDLDACFGGMRWALSPVLEAKLEDLDSDRSPGSVDAPGRTKSKPKSFSSASGSAVAIAAIAALLALAFAAASLSSASKASSSESDPKPEPSFEPPSSEPSPFPPLADSPASDAASGLSLAFASSAALSKWKPVPRRVALRQEPSGGGTPTYSKSLAVGSTASVIKTDANLSDLPFLVFFFFPFDFKIPRLGLSALAGFSQGRRNNGIGDSSALDVTMGRPEPFNTKAPDPHARGATAELDPRFSGTLLLPSAA